MWAWMIMAALGYPGQGETPEDCRECHRSAYAGWAESRHAVARTNPIFSASFDHFSHPWCLSCHAPEAPEHGVGCASCHTDEGTATCRTCHEFNFQKHTPRAPFALGDHPAQETVSEWEGSTAAAKGTGCVDCHMGAQGHRFPGGHDADLVRGLLQVDTERQEGAVVVTVSAPGAAHRVPTGDPFRRLELRLCGEPSCETVLAFHTFRRVVERTETSWRITEDRSIPPQTSSSAAQRSIRLHPEDAAMWWRLDYRYGDRRFEPDLPEHAVGYRIAEGPLETP